MEQRTIEFRVHVKATGEILPVVEIDWRTKEVRCVVCGKYEDPSDGMVREDWDFPVFSFDEIDLEQFTGKEDKNGKKIFEGHRVKVHGHEYNVIFNERMTSFDIATTGNGIGFYNSKDIEITGTIHK